MRVVAVLTALLATGCIVDLWAGGGVAKQPTSTSHELTFGASFGFYLDPHKARTRVSYSAQANGTYMNDKGTVQNVEMNGWSEVRADYAFEQDGDEQRRITGMVLWGKHPSYTLTAEPDGNNVPTSTPWKVFLGYTRDTAYQRGHVWGDALSWSVGPTYTHFDTGAAGTVHVVGVEGHFTIAATVLFALASSFNELFNCTCAYTSDSGDGGGDDDE